MNIGFPESGIRTGANAHVNRSHGRELQRQQRLKRQATDVKQGSEVSRLKDLNIETDRDSFTPTSWSGGSRRTWRRRVYRESSLKEGLSNTSEENEVEQEPLPQRAAIREGESPSLRARESQVPPRRFRAKPNSAPYSEKIAPFDFTRNGNTRPMRQQPKRPAPAGSRISNTSTYALPTDSVPKTSPSSNDPRTKLQRSRHLDSRPHQSAG